MSPVSKFALVVVGVTAILAWVLASEGRGRAKDIAACQIDALKTYPDGPSIFWHRPVQLCMEARGYEWTNMQDLRCGPKGDSNDNVFFSPYCYRANTLLGKAAWYLDGRGR